MQHDQHGMDLKFPLTVNILLITKPHGVVAHNLDFDLVAEGKTRPEAERRICECTKAHVEYALENGVGALIYQPAPPELWDLVLNARISGRVLTINLDKEQEAETQNWMLAVRHAISGTAVAA